jgi:SAM-dependent methyltransferase
VTELDVLAGRWATKLAAWAIPDEILRRAPESPWGFPTDLFSDAAKAALEEPSPSPSRRRALEAIPSDGSVLDVGAGAGAASLPLAPPARRIVAVDESSEMLENFTALADARSVSHATVLGGWPDAEQATEPADLVVCHHVLYNVSDIVPFVQALDRHARRRVVVELTEAHPQAELNTLWKVLHGIVRPDGPTAEDAAELLRAMDLPLRVEKFTRPGLWAHADRTRRVAFARRRLCVGPERDAEIDRLLPSGPRRLVTMWWER